MDKVQNLDIPKILKFNIFKPIILIRRQYVLWNNSNAVGMGRKVFRVASSIRIIIHASIYILLTIKTFENKNNGHS